MAGHAHSPLPNGNPIVSPLVLAGFMGCGKTTVGRLLAQRLGWHFCDLDERIESVAGVPIATIFARQGEAAYRELEREQLLLALGKSSADRRTVLALGGGTFVQAANLEAIRRSSGSTVFLEVPMEELLLRCARMTNRPLFRDEATFRALYEQRLPFYRQAQITVAGGGEPSRVVERVLEQFTPPKS